jgi:hypothetical protein
MSEPRPPQPPPEQPYQLPGTEPAWEPDTLPEHPLRAQNVPALIPKVIA